MAAVRKPKVDVEKARLVPNPDRFLQVISRDLTASIKAALRDNPAKINVKSMVDQAVKGAIVHLPLADPADPVTRFVKPVLRGRKKAGQALSTDILKPDEVLERGLVEMSRSQLYRATEQGRFYCTKPRGKAYGRMFPVWQFTEPVPALLPEVIALLAEHDPGNIHARLVTAEDNLHELAPAEVLAGRVFDPTVVLNDDQQQLLGLPDAERLALVREVLEEPPIETAIG